VIQMQAVVGEGGPGALDEVRPTTRDWRFRDYGRAPRELRVSVDNDMD